MCKSGGECVCGPQRGCKCESGCCVGDFLIEVSVQRVCKGCARVHVSVQRCVKVGMSGCLCLKECTSVCLTAARVLLQRGECGTSVQGACKCVHECARGDMSV